MSFNGIKDAAMIVLMFLVFGVPAVAIAARLAIKPLLDTFIRLREGAPANNRTVPDARIASLEAEVSRLSVEVQRLSETQAFDRQLTKGS